MCCPRHTVGRSVHSLTRNGDGHSISTNNTAINPVTRNVFSNLIKLIIPIINLCMTPDPLACVLSLTRFGPGRTAASLLHITNVVCKLDENKFGNWLYPGSQFMCRLTHQLIYKTSLSLIYVYISYTYILCDICDILTEPLRRNIIMMSYRSMWCHYYNLYCVIRNGRMIIIGDLIFSSSHCVTGLEVTHSIIRCGQCG